jgi:hypothetical protein
LDSPIVVAIILVATISLASGISYYVVVMNEERQKLAEARYAVSLLTGFADAVRSLGFEGQRSAFLRYGFTYGGWQLVDDGVSSVSFSLNGGNQTLLTTNHPVFEYFGRFSAYGSTRLYEARSENVAIASSPFKAIVVYSYGTSGYSYSVADPRIYVAYSVSGQLVQVSIYVFQFTALVSQGPPKALMTLTGTIQHDSYTFNVFTPDPCWLYAVAGNVSGSLNIPVSVGDTVQVEVNSITVGISFSL